MKKIYLPILCLALLSSCLGYKELPVEYDYSYKGNFKRYRTYDIMKAVGTTDSTMTSEVIARSIIARMKFLGYKRAEKRPHLIIGYKMFPDSLRFNGYVQPDIETWVKNRDQTLSYDAQK